MMGQPTGAARDTGNRVSHRAQGEHSSAGATLRGRHPLRFVADAWIGIVPDITGGQAIVANSVPEPSTLALLGLAVAVAGC